jgi:transcriptional regulator with GAF, ATPase, and Fis domain
VVETVRAVSKLLRNTALVVLDRGLRGSTVMQLARLGVCDVLDLPQSPEALFAKLRSHLSSLTTHSGLEGIVGDSDAIQSVRRQVLAVARTDSTVLLTGETGTGKGLVASAIHARSVRRAAPFVQADCTVFSPSVIESELFGHERGAFTDARDRRRGRFELAERGTILLDEVGDLEPSLQTKLLRVLQERIYERVGGTTSIEMGARIIAATNCDLDRAMREGRFRRDLYYRLKVYHIHLPPLRDRIEDVPQIARAELESQSRRLARRAPELSTGFCQALVRHAWPGNVRELKNTIERCLIGRESGILDASDLEGILDEMPRQTASTRAELPSLSGDVRFSPEDLADRECIARALSEADGNVARSARRLGMSRSKLRYRIRKYELGTLIPSD